MRVAVIGFGIAAIAAALELRRAGIGVSLIQFYAGHGSFEDTAVVDRTALNEDPVPASHYLDQVVLPESN